jgi:DNA polymerase III delta prime subunit
MIDRFKNLWIEKYRPETRQTIAMSESNREIVSKFYSDKEIPNLLFVGNAGIGKTSLAKILVNDALKCQYLYINASDENGIDTIRTKVTNFSRVKSLDGNIKVIILDEVDGLTLDAQRALRNTMEEYSAYTRFILTANYKHKVIPPLQSRCQTLDLVPPLNEFVDRCFNILQAESIEADLKDVEKISRELYPDLRRTINEIQKCCISGKFTLRDKKGNESLIKALFELIKSNNVLKARKMVIQNEVSFNSDYNELLKELFNYIDSSSIKEGKRKALLTVSEYMYRMSFVMDPEINFYSCIIAVSNVIHP